MNNLTFGLLAIMLVVIVSMALSASSIGAKIVQGMIAITILALLVRDNSAVQQKWGDATKLVLQSTKQPTSSGGN